MNDSACIEEMFIFGFFIVLIVLVALGGFLFVWQSGSAMQTSHATITVTDKVGAHGESGQYLVFTDTEVFTVEDNVFEWSFDATDRYNSIKVGKTYNVTLTGERNHFWSMYRNIIAIEEV